MDVHGRVVDQVEGRTSRKWAFSRGFAPCYVRINGPTATLGPMVDVPRFHLAFPVDDLDAARSFYGEVLGCPEGRRDDRWIDFDLYGHQIVAHRTSARAVDPAHNPVDGDDVPVPHFGVLLETEAWAALGQRLKTAAGVEFVIEPRIRFQGQAGEQRTMFLLDPAGGTRWSSSRSRMMPECSPSTEAPTVGSRP